ncbi:DNA/RNA polymerases superfamily protein [Gossypium australe]|uniref:DNA/RNA polymerases superfamily protein n=1 Tax=Gossypium australe TaxID=47621 RepID=A0A5B6VXJ5_9ROSI|nr:DNA/RNA polymerases superfamily protein [Gossypium australe]
MSSLTTGKSEHQVSSRLLQPIMIFYLKWERVMMDIILGLPVIVDQLTKSTHFIPVRTDYFLEMLVELYVSEIVRLHGVSISIISDRDSRFTSRFWGKLLKALGTKLNFSTTFHSQIDALSEWVIILWNTCYSVAFSSWRVAGKNIQRWLNLLSNIKMAPFEALYKRKCRISLYWLELSDSKLVETNLIRETEDKTCIILDCLKVAWNRKDIKFSMGDRLFLKDSPWKKVLRFGRKGNLSLRFIGPYEIIERICPTAYRLALHLELEKIHNIFHVLMLRRYRSDPSNVIPPSEIEL